MAHDGELDLQGVTVNQEREALAKEMAELGRSVATMARRRKAILETPESAEILARMDELLAQVQMLEQNISRMLDGAGEEQGGAKNGGQ